MPGHHLLSIRNLIASSPDESYPETASSIADDINFFMNNFTAEEGPYIIAEVLKPGTYKLANDKGEVLTNA